MPTFGPGTLTIGATGTELDLSCAVNSARITPSKDAADSKTMLCGTSKPGKITYTYTLTGNVDVDSQDPKGFFALCAASPGTEQPFEFTPSTEGETSAAGTLIIDPLDFGADEYGDDLASDFEFTIIGAPVYTFPAAAPAAPAGFARVVVNGAGTPTASSAPVPPGQGDPAAAGAPAAADLIPA